MANVVSTTIESSREKVQTEDISAVAPVKMYSYPSTIANNPAHSNYLVFHITEALAGENAMGSSLQARRTSFLKSPASMKTIGMIQMYMPALLENLDHNYKDNQSNMIDDLMATFAKTPGDLADRAIGTAKEAPAIGMEHLEQKALNNPTSVRQFGQIQGQRQTLLYGGTQLRTQTFFFTLRARNLIELKEIGEIIYMFRRYSTGSITSNTINISNRGADSYGTVKVPPVWFIEERTKGSIRPRSIDKFMMGPASIMNVKVNKTPDQLYQSLAGTAGDPVSVELEVTFKEMVPTYSDFWDELRGVTKTNSAGELPVISKYIKTGVDTVKDWVDGIF